MHSVRGPAFSIGGSTGNGSGPVYQEAAAAPFPLIFLNFPKDEPAEGTTSEHLDVAWTVLGCAQLSASSPILSKVLFEELT